MPDNPRLDIRYPRRRALWIWPVATVLLLAPALVLPRALCGLDADAYFDGERGAVLALADGVAEQVARGVDGTDFSTGSERFDWEWVFGTYMMAGMGLTQVVQQHPDAAQRHGAAIEACIDRLLTPALRGFDRQAWKADPLETLDGDEGHAAYLGYLNLLLGLHRKVTGSTRYAELNDRISSALVRRVQQSPTLLLETYPGEVYPVDNSAVIGSIALHGRVAGIDRGALVRDWVEACRRRYIDRESGMLYQAVSRSGRPADLPRASGTALAAYFVSFADTGLSRELFVALERSCATSVLGFGMMREYPPNVPTGQGDIDSGPVLLGLSLSGTGFAMAGARIHGDRELFRSIYRVVHMFGCPVDQGERRSFVGGGPLGNAIMLGMLTAKGQGT